MSEINLQIEGDGTLELSPPVVNQIIQAISPEVTMSRTSEGAVITIVDKNGSHTVNLYDGQSGSDGQDGQDGTDGVSPTVSVEESEDGATVTITDATGDHVFTLTNGADGTDGTNGTDGVDGFSPTASVTKSGTVATITITDVNGTTQTTVSDGDPTGLIDDTASTGDTGYTWSADKLVGAFAEKYEKPATGIPATDIASGVIPDVSGKMDEPSTAGTEGQVLTSDGEGGYSWEDPTGGDPTEIIDDTAGSGDTDKVWSADKSADVQSATMSAIQQSSIEDLLLRDELPGTTTAVTMDSNGNPTSIVHSANGTTVRTDSFVWSSGSVTETRTASTKYITITTNLDTLAQTISAIQEVA